MVAIYYVLPLDRVSTWVAVVMLAIGLALVGLIVFQVRKIIWSPFPGLWAVEALATSIPLFLLLFAAAYLVLSTASTGNFYEHLTHTRALYFTITVFSTEGFGDIKARSDAARPVITGQMIADLVILAVALKVVVGAVKRGHQRRSESDPGQTQTRGRAARPHAQSAAGRLGICDDSAVTRTLAAVAALCASMVAAAPMAGCGYRERVCSDGEHPVWTPVREGPAGEACARDGAEPPSGYMTYPPDLEPEYLDEIITCPDGDCQPGPLAIDCPVTYPDEPCTIAGRDLPIPPADRKGRSRPRPSGFRKCSPPMRSRRARAAEVGPSDRPV